MKTRNKLSSRILALFLAVVFCFNIIPTMAIETFLSTENQVDDGDDNSIITNNEIVIESEDIALRTEFTKHYKLNNGTYLAVQYNQPIHKLNENNEWINIDSSFLNEPATNEKDFDGYVNETQGNTIKVSNNTENTLWKIFNSEKESYLSFEIGSNNNSTVFANIVEPTFDSISESESTEERNNRIINEPLKSSEIHFSNVFEGVNFIYGITPHGLDGKLIINETCMMNEFEFKFDVGDLNASLDNLGNIQISDATGELVYTIASPYVYDADYKIYDIAQYELNDNGDGSYTLTICINSSLLNTTNINYPITVKTGVSIASDDNSYIDPISVTSISTANLLRDNMHIDVGKLENNLYRTFLKFNELPSLKNSDVFISAKLKTTQIIKNRPIEDVPLNIAAYSITDVWDSDTITWDTQPMYSDRILYTKSFDNSNDTCEDAEWNITEEIRKFYEGNSSYGIALVSTNETNEGYISSFPLLETLPFNSYLMVNYFPYERDNESDLDESDLFEEVTSSVILNESDTNCLNSTDVNGEITTVTDTTTTSEGIFREVTSDITMSYCVGENWYTHSNGTIVDRIDGIRILTNDKLYYFKYKSRNVDKGWLGYVHSYNSGDTDYAGLYNYAMTNLAIEVYEGSARLYDNYVVMYRAYVDGQWLDWVSNGQPEVMESIKSQFGLDGKLDTSSTDAGWYTLGNIQGLVIRVFEKTGYEGTSLNQFEELFDFTQQYYVNDGWNNLTSDITLEGIDGIRLGTTSDEYYFKYKSRNTSHGWLDPVYSFKSGVYDYAGWPEDPMRHLAIEVYNSSGTRIYDDYVVMYRAKVAGDWLAWVSNGQPDVMQTIQTEFNLEGQIDTASTDAGWYSKGNIQSIEIRMFKRINSVDDDSQGTVETDAFDGATGITMEYYKNRTFTSFSNVFETNLIDGIRLRTNNKPYYFKYRTKDSTHGWLDFVTSNSSNQSDYAGWPEFPTTHVEIQVFTRGGTRIYDNYVVMYRAKVGGTWLDWVSNGKPIVMESIKAQFNLEGELDTEATDAGWASLGSIQALEIRVYERKGLAVNPSENAVLIEAPYINQDDVGLPNGCESVSAVMALQYYGMNINSEEFVTKYLDRGPAPVVNGLGPDPSIVYAGDPHSYGGWGCYAPVIVKAINKYIDKSKYSVQELSNQSLETLCSTYIDNGIPVIIWATVNMEKGVNKYWTTPTGKRIAYNNKLHCLLLVGYDEEKDLYYINDPKVPGTGEYDCVEYNKTEVAEAYEALNYQAIVITTKDGLPPSTPNEDTLVGSTIPKITVTEEKPIEKNEPLDVEYVADPIDLSTGAHIINHNLMSIFGAQTININANYRSNLKTSGELGTGWTHNYEKKLVVDGNSIKVYDSATYYSLYNPTAEDPNTYTTETTTKNNYILKKIGSNYEVNCNNNAIEYYDSYGRLYKITAKNGFNTLITYPDSNTTKVTDEISGKFIVISKNSDGKITLLVDNTGKNCVLEYTDGCLTSIKDINGNTTSYQYVDGLIKRGMDEAGTTYFVNTYDSANRIIEQRDAISGHNSTVINYDDSNSDYLLVKVFDRELKQTVYKYNSSKQLISKTDANGVEVLYEYDAAGNLSKETDGLGYSVINEYDNRNNLISVTDKLGRKTEYTYDDNNNLTRVDYPNDSFITNTYDTNNRMVSSTDVRGVVTTYEYDTLGQLIKTTYLGKSTEYEYQNGRVTSVTDRLGRETINNYDDEGLLVSSTDSNNNTTYYTYDNKGNVLTVTDALGNVTTKEYDSNGSLIKVTDAKGNSTKYTYNGNLKMTSMTLPTGTTLYYEYDSEDRLICVTFPDGRTTETTYDDAGRVISEKDKDGNVTSYEYDAVGNVIKTTSANGGITTKEYDAIGNVIKSTDARGNITTYEYDVMGNLTKVINAMGGITQYTYNASGDLLTVTDPLGNTTTNSYDNRGNLVSVTDPRGNTTSYTYDEVGNILTVTNALGQVTTNTYDSLNRLVSTKDPGNHTTTYTYDALGRLTATTDARGNTIHQFYDELGNIIKVTDQSGYIDFETKYDEGGRAVEVTDAAGNTTYNVYDYSGNLTKKVDALGNTTTYTYNGNGQMISAVDSMGGISYATYDGMGNLTSMTGPAGSLKEYVYNAAGLVTSESTVTGWDNNYTYNALGLVTKKVGASYATTNYVYDAAGRLTSYTETAGNTSYTVSYTYDANGNILTVTDESGTVTREYDALNRVIRYIDTLGNIVLYEYDSCGNLSKMTYPNGEQAVYTYDANHNMISTSLANSTYVTTYEYNAQNQLTKIYRPDGSICTKSYNSAGQLTNSNDMDVNGDFIVVNVFYYDKLGRITEEINLEDFSWYFMTYDSLGRLVKRVEKDIRNNAIRDTEIFTYDAAGNILTDSDGNTFRYSENNVIEAANGITYFTDNKGNATWTFGEGFVDAVYDQRSRIVSTNSNGYQYTYDAENNRVSMTSETSSMYYTHDTSDGRNRLIWTKDQDDVETIYGYGADGIVWSLCNGEYKFYHYDYRGSVKAVTGIDGTVTDTIKYDVYGNISERTGTSEIILGYNGKYGVLTDPSGLLYMRTRYYSPDLKRFMSADIINGTIADSTSLNLYTYVNGNPISFVDPFGLCRDDPQNNPNVTYDQVSASIHTVLDVAGMIPALGMIPDGINGIYYVLEGDWKNATVSALAFLPVVGDIGVVGKYIKKGAGLLDNAFKGVVNLFKKSDDVKDGIKAVQNVTETVKDIDNLKDAGTITKKVHGNSLSTTETTYGYALRKNDTDEIMKYGETIKGTKRYTNKFYEENDVYMDIMTEGTKYDMHYWQHEKIIEYYNANGHKPPLNKSFW